MSYFLRFLYLIGFILITNVSLVSFGNDLESDSYNLDNESLLNVFAPGDTITGSITGTASVCLNTTRPVITFTGKGGTAPYIFVYQINSDADITTNSTISGKDTLTVKVLTNSAGTFIYTLKKVTDSKGVSQVLSEKVTITVNPLPKVDFTFTNENTCSGTPIQFSPSLTGSYTYWWEFGDKLNSSLSNPVHEYYAIGIATENFKIKLRTIENATSCQDTAVKIITVKQIPDAALDTNRSDGATYFDKTNKLFVNCLATNTSPQFMFVAVNASKTRATNSSYSIDWGDGTPVENLPSSFTKITHTYNSLGFFNIKLISNSDKSECKSGVTIYKFFNGNSPAGNLGSLGNYTDCAPFTLKWPVQNTASNPPGTTYEFTVNDGSPPKIFDINSLPDTISHTFTKSSCGLKDNKFTVSFIAKNPCDQSVTTLQVLATEKPTAKFTSTNLCLNSPMRITNTSSGNYVMGNTCISDFDKTWTITPNTGWTGTLSNNNFIDIKFNTAGEYQIKLKIEIPYTTDSRCTADSITQKITINPLPTATMTGDATVCQYATSPEITFTGANGTAPYTFTYTYKLDNGTQKTETIKTIGSNNSVIYKAPTDNAGTHTYTLVSVQESSSSACSQAQTGSAKIIVNPAGQVNNPGSLFVCNGETALIDFSTKNTTGTTTYSWTNSNTDIGLDASGKGNISFTPINTGNSILTTTISVVPTYTANGVSCDGKPEQFTVTVNPTPTVDQPADQTVCNGYKTTDIKFTGTTPNTIYKWSIDKQIGVPLSGTGDILAFTTVNTGAVPVEATVTVTPVINNCNGESKNFKITVNPSPLITKQPLSSTICFGKTPFPLSVSYTNAVDTPSYQWYSNTSSSTAGSTLIENETNSSFNPPFSTVGTMYYYCVITFPTVGCNTLTSNIAKITINPVPAISSFNEEINSGDEFTVIPNDLNGDIVPPGTTYIWPEPEISPAGSVTGSTAQSTPQSSISQKLIMPVAGISTVTYTVTPISGTCIGAPFKITVKVNVPLKINETVKPVSCFGANDGSIQTNIEGGAPFHTGTRYNTSWTGPNGFTSTLPSISNLAPGNYSLVFADSLGPRNPIVYTISEPNELIVNTITEKDLSYFGTDDGMIDISVSGGTGAYKYAWTKDGVSFAATEDIKNLSSGLYKVTVTDINNCGPKILPFTISEPAAIVIRTVSQTDVKCFGESTGAVSVEVQGGTMVEITPGNFDYQYSWTGSNGFTSNKKDLNNIPAGNYLLTVTDNSGFKKTFPVEIKESEQILVSAIKTAITCYGDNNASMLINVSGGVPPYQINWDNFLTGSFHDNLSAGDYSITVSDANFCEKTIKESIAEANIFRINPEIKHVSCYGANNGRIALNFEGGMQPITFSWADNPNAGATRNNIGSGTYTVNIAEGGGCIISKTFLIIEPLPLVLNASISSVFDCNMQNGGAIDLEVSGGTSPYKYAWSTGVITEDLKDIPEGNYSVTVTDSIGCTKTGQFTIKRPSTIETVLDAKIDFDCNNKKIKKIYTAIIKGGVPPYKLEWSTGKISGVNNETMETDQNGTVVLTVTDTLGCIAINTFETNIPKPGIEEKLVNCNQYSYQFNAIVPDEMKQYIYLWDFGDGTTSDLKNPIHLYKSEGIYKVLLSIKDNSNLCTITYEQPIVAEARPKVNIDKKEPKFCEGDSILILANGADFYKWTNGTSGDSILIKTIGNYSVIGETIAGCTDTIDFSVLNFEKIEYPLNKDKIEVTPEENSVYFSTNNVPFSNYTWDFGDGSFWYSNEVTHPYDIIGDGHFDVKLNVINPFGCVTVDSARIEISRSIPNTFTPNGDGINDFYLKGWNKKIFNRNGILLFEGEDGWDGTYQRKPVANDTYFVIVYDSYSLAGSTPKTNYVTVLR